MHPDVAARMPLQSIRSSMLRARNAVAGPIPATLQEYGAFLGVMPRFGLTLQGDEFYRGTIVDQNGHAGVLFASPTILARVPHLIQLHIDGTFKVVPPVPYSYQLLTVSVIFFDKVRKNLILFEYSVLYHFHKYYFQYY